MLIAAGARRRVPHGLQEESGAAPEGQLEELNAYLKKSTISYQQEIMRLRTAITKVDPAFK